MALQFGCASQKPEPVMASEKTTASAKVAAVDYEHRVITLVTPQLGEFAVVAGPEVRNFAQIKPGDSVNVTYVQAVAAQLSASDKPQPGLIAEQAAGTAAPGERPAAAIGRSVSADVVIESYDANMDVVTFRNADGQRRVVRVERPEMRDFAKHLKAGDIVTITFLEAVAVDVRSASDNARVSEAP
jgi:hypothetical protein